MPSPIDILLWTDTFWCFRQEFSLDIQRGRDYRVVMADTGEWYQLARSKHPLKPS